MVNDEREEDKEISLMELDNDMRICTIGFVSKSIKTILITPSTLLL